MVGSAIITAYLCWASPWRTCSIRTVLQGGRGGEACEGGVAEKVGPVEKEAGVHKQLYSVVRFD